MVSSGKRKRDGFAAQHQNGQHIPQQDGAVDPAPEEFEVYILFSFCSQVHSQIFFFSS